jgi:proliferating cell nuclear antigen
MTDYIMECKTVQTTVFKNLTEALKDILTDVNIEFNRGHSDAEKDEDKGSIKIVAMDSSQTILVHLKLEGARYEYYSCKKRMIIGISMMYFYKLIKTISNSNDCITLCISEKDPNRLIIKLDNSDKNTYTIYKLNLMDIKHDDVSIPPQSFENIISMPSVDFQKICRDMSALSDKVEIKNIGNKLIFSCVGDVTEQETICNEHDGLTFQNGTESFDDTYSELKWKMDRIPFNERFKGKFSVVDYQNQGWKRKYYEVFFDLDINKDFDNENVKDICKNYLEGIYFTMKYYFDGEDHWEWYNPYFVSPFASDIYSYMKDNDINSVKLDKGKPFTPLEQLMLVLPKTSFEQLPDCLVNGIKDKLILYYPEEFGWCSEEKFMVYSIEPKLPLFDLEKVREVFESKSKLLTERENERNSLSEIYIR